jgi:ABC-type transport system involved in multi-copper enzyme maturation permease subunit
VNHLGISPIEYRPWKGKRTDPNTRLLVITKKVIGTNLKAKGVIVILIIGIFLVHAFPIIFAVFTPHEEITDEDMIGSETNEDANEATESSFNTTGFLMVNQSLRINGEFYVEGLIFIGGELSLIGTIEGNGTLQGTGGISQNGIVNINGSFELTGGFSVWGFISGNGTISGFGDIMGIGNVSGNASDEVKDENVDFEMFQEGYLKNGLFAIFTMFLAAIICSDVIADDRANSSFVLYFSRPTRAMDYLVGKFTGLIVVMSIFCIIPPIFYVLVMMGTQTGSDYGGGMVILGKTILMGIFTAIFFLPFGLMISSFTKSKAYAGVSIFMSFFVLSIISGLFAQFDNTWNIINPFNMLTYTYDLLFGSSLNFGIQSYQLAIVILALTIIPMIIVSIRLQRMGAGK